jgi:hypothetical protein
MFFFSHIVLCGINLPAFRLANSRAAIAGTTQAYVDFEDLTGSGSLGSQEEAGVSSIATDIREQPAIVLLCMALAMHQAMHDAYVAEHQSSRLLPDSSPLLPFITCRLFNYEPVIICFVCIAYVQPRYRAAAKLFAS